MAPDANMPLGPLRLRKNKITGLIENAAFDDAIAVYEDSYQNSQAHSVHFLAHMQQVLSMLKAQFPAGSTLVEVGCGKGDFLALVIADGHFDASGYDATYEGTNPKIHKRYLTAQDRLKADIVVLRHVLEHIPQPHHFLHMLHTVFADAAVYIEVPSFEWIAANETFFDITYEHVNYFTHQALSALFGHVQLAFGELFADQYQYIIANLANLDEDFNHAYASQNWEQIAFANLFPGLLRKIEMLAKHAQTKRHIYLWGAATKGCMFLVHCQRLGQLVGQVKLAVDVNPNKVGRFLPVSQVKIVAPETLLASLSDEDLILIANPNYAEEINHWLQARDFGNVETLCL